jgi:hypothetical protein
VPAIPGAKTRGLNRCGIIKGGEVQAGVKMPTPREPQVGLIHETSDSHKVYYGIFISIGISIGISDTWI